MAELQPMGADAEQRTRLSPATQGSLRRSDIQGLRGVAVLAVVLFHAGSILPGGFVGVDVFFVISGFVITGLIVRERERTQAFSFRNFYVRRARRLLPAAAVMTTATVLLASTLMTPLGGLQSSVAGAATAATAFVANFFFLFFTGGYFQPQAEGNPLLHTWSLSVEEQFYLVFPLMLLFAMVRLGKLGTRWLLALAGLASFTIGVLTSYPATLASVPIFGELSATLGSSLAFYAPWSRAWEFLAGSILFLSARNLSLGLRASNVIGAAGATLLMVSLVLINESLVFPGLVAAVPVLATVLMIASGTNPSSATARLLSTRWITWLGDRSYSWYLWHWPVIVFMTLWLGRSVAVYAVAAAGSLILAAGSYRLVESPIHDGRILIGRKATAALLACAFAVPLVAAQGLRMAHDASWWQTRLVELQQSISAQYPPEATGCPGGYIEALGDDRCRFETRNPVGRILLIGDSHALHYSGPVIAAANGLGLATDVITQGGCPLILPSQGNADQCFQSVESALDALDTRDQQYNLIVVANSSSSYPFNRTAQERYIETGTTEAAAEGSLTRTSQALEGWTSGLQRSVQRLTSIAPVLVIGDIPQAGDVPRCLAPSPTVRTTRDCGVPSVSQLENRNRIAELEGKAVEDAGANYVDIGGALCSTQQGCSLVGGDEAKTRDGGHLTAETALGLTNVFGESFMSYGASLQGGRSLE